MFGTMNCGFGVFFQQNPLVKQKRTVGPFWPRKLTGGLNKTTGFDRQKINNDHQQNMRTDHQQRNRTMSESKLHTQAIYNIIKIYIYIYIYYIIYIYVWVCANRDSKTMIRATPPFRPHTQLFRDSKGIDSNESWRCFKRLSRESSNPHTR